MNRATGISLSDLTPNGDKTIGLWAAPYWARITKVSLSYDIVPTSTAGAITMVINKVSGGVLTALTSAVFDIESMTDRLGANIPLDLTKTTLITNDYVFMIITSDNADAQVGTGGVVTLNYDVNPAKN